MKILHIRLLKTFREKSQGLLGASKAHPVMFSTRWGIHTIGMKFPIDVLILNKENKVVKFRKNMPPNEIFMWPPFFNTVIELPAGEVDKMGIKIGEKIKVEIV
jgi:uncharacterized protein